MTQQRPLTILLVEDNEIDVEVTRRAIEKTDTPHTLQVARDGWEALDVLFEPDSGNDRPGLILLDLRLPGVDGWEVLRRLKNDPELCAIPVAILTGQPDRMMESLKNGGNMYFVKPMTSHDAEGLLPAVNKYWAVVDELAVGEEEPA